MSAPSTPITLNVIAFVDYDYRQANDKVLVQVGDHYFQYNKAKGYNAGTIYMRDQLVVVQKRSDERTTLRAGLDSSTGPYMGGSLQIRVCRAYRRANGIDVMEVSVGARSTNCGIRGGGSRTGNDNNGGSWSNRAPTYGNSNTNNNNDVSYIRNNLRVVTGGTSSNNNNNNRGNWQSSWRASNSRTTTTTNRNNNYGSRWSRNPGGAMNIVEQNEEQPKDTEAKRLPWRQFLGW
jgi:hypothetical protein